MTDEKLRVAILEWLQTNDRNGCYTDENCQAELGFTVTLKEAIKLLYDDYMQWGEI